MLAHPDKTQVCIVPVAPPVAHFLSSIVEAFHALNLMQLQSNAVEWWTLDPFSQFSGVVTIPLLQIIANQSRYETVLLMDYLWKAQHFSTIIVNSGTNVR